MPINLIANVIYYKNKLVIGQNEDLVVRLTEDMKFFKTITSTQCSSNKNIVVMGRRTWNSIPNNARPLQGRINIVLTRDSSMYNVNVKKINKINLDDTKPFFMSFEIFKKLYKMIESNVFVIGGGEIYDLFLKSDDQDLKPERCWLTQVIDYPVIELKEQNANLTTIEPLDWFYSLISVSQNFTNKNLNYRILHYKYTEKPSSEIAYLDLLRRVLMDGKDRIDRTGVGTISKFGDQMRFDISQTVPLLTTKTIPWKMVIEELLWFMRGDTDAKILQRRGIKIWDGNSSRAFLDSRGLVDYPEGVLGPVYGYQWRFFGAEYNTDFADTSNSKPIDGVDQLENVIHQLKNDPFSRRIVLSAWNPKDLDKMALPPCHFQVQFYVEEKSGFKYLSCHMYQRSQDEFLGCPFNIFSYTVLTYILAKRCNMLPKELVISVGDAHIYKNHMTQVLDQLSRLPRALPKLIVNDTIATKPIEQITVDDFELWGYFPHPIIRASMAV